LARARSRVAPLALRYSRPRAGRAARNATGGLRVFLPAFAGSVGLSLPLLDHPLWGFCLSAVPSGLLLLLRATLRPDGARAQLGGASGRLPRRRPSWLAGPRVPCFASAGRSAPTARRCGRLRHRGVALRAAFFSATAGAVSRVAGGRSAGSPLAFSASPAGSLGAPDPPPTAFRTVAPQPPAGSAGLARGQAPACGQSLRFPPAGFRHPPRPCSADRRHPFHALSVRNRRRRFSISYNRYGAILNRAADAIVINTKPPTATDQMRGACRRAPRAPSAPPFIMVLAFMGSGSGASLPCPAA
jgi:hypothetical protein